MYASLGAVIFSLYIVFDTQMMLGGKHKVDSITLAVSSSFSSRFLSLNPSPNFRDIYYAKYYDKGGREMISKKKN